jgi:ubiquinol-cytochrome c reductase cytochrome b subunit
MIRPLLGWLEDRTGIKGLLHEVLFERIPGGARWRYVWGSTLTFTFTVQVLTGLILWAAYSPSAQTAWESVFYIQHELWGGWLVRGIHHYTAQAMIILLVLHFLQVLIDGAYRAPREVNFWFGLLMLMVVLALSLTGYLLPWDQKGYWATRVATNIVGITPIIGPSLQQMLMGGADTGHHTLTRFFALHAGILPATLVFLTIGHILLFRRHGLKARTPFRKPDAYFWPDQLLRDAAACAGIMAVVLALVYFVGTPLYAPADPAEQFSAAQPEWYFLFLYQLLKYFPGESEIIGAIVIPALATGIIFLMPLIGRWKAGHYFNVVVVAALIVASAWLTVEAVRENRTEPSRVRAMAQAERDAQRAEILARAPDGIPMTGAVSLLRSDPYTRGPRLFAEHCAICHRYGGEDGLGGVPNDEPSASDLKGFASREWLRGLLDTNRIDSLHYFGGTKFKDGRMSRFVKRDIPRFDEEERHQLERVIKAVSAEAALPAQAELDARETADIEAGRQAIINETVRCSECHEFHKPDDEAIGPMLTGYGSRDWLIRFISDPAHESFYGRRNDRMPAFRTNGILTAREIEIIADWLRGDWYQPPAQLPAVTVKTAAR